MLKNYEKPLVSVIILSYNTKEVTLNCLDKLKISIEHAKVPVETIVVENGSDGTSDEIRKNYNWVKLIEPRVNTGFTKGNNLALKHISKFSKFVLLSPTTVALSSKTLGVIVG